MFKFLRRIRQRLLNEGSLRKYSAYTVGEILLVVIGILIALQINNWNDNRKTRQTEIKVLEELVFGLSGDIKTLKYNIDKHKRAKESCEIILEILEGNGTFTDSLAGHFAATHYYTVSFSKRGAYESLKSMGFQIISNKDLRVKIIDLYEQWFRIIQVNQEILTNEIQNIKRDFNQDHFDKFLIFDVAHPEDIYAGQMIPNDFSNLKQSTQYRYYLKSLHASHSFVLLQSYYSIDMINSLIDQLNNEINRLK